MVGTPKDVAAAGEVGMSKHAQSRTRAALSGTIFVMSVLAYLGDHETTILRAVLTVVGTGVVIFFAEAYAGLMVAALSSVRRLPGGEIRAELGACSTAAAPGALAGIVLLVADLVGLSAQAGINIALWGGVAGLTVCSFVATHAARRSRGVQIGMVVASVIVGSVIVLLKAKLH